MPTILDVAAQFRSDLADIERDAVTQLVGAYAGILDGLQSELRGLVMELRAQPGPITQAQLNRNERLRALIRQVQDQIDRLANQMGTLLPLWQYQTATLGEQAAQQLMLAGIGDNPPVTVTFNRLPTDAIAQLLGTLANGSPLQALLAELGPEAAATVKRELLRGLAQGLNPRAVARRMREALGQSLTRALTIARTEMLRAYREASRATYQENSDVVAGWVWVAKLDRRTCAFCWAQHGSFHKLNAPMATHPQCFPAGTLVSGPKALASSDRYYAGRVVEIETASGKLLTATPNHPILTTQGWVAAGLLNEGDDVISRAAGEWPLPAINPDDNDVPALIENVAHSLGSALPVPAVRVPTSAVDFHGDGGGSDVSVIRTNGALGDSGNPVLLKPVAQEFFGRGYTESPLLARSGYLDSMLHAALATTGGGVSGRDVAEVFGGAAPAHHQPVSLGTSANRNARVLQPSANRRSGSVELFGETVLRFASDVAVDDLIVGESGHCESCGRHLGGGDSPRLRHAAPEIPFAESGTQPFRTDVESVGSIIARLPADVCADRILKIRTRGFRGHVYNLQTAEEWYIANGIIVHNCRCAPVPRTKTWAELGFPGIAEAVPLIPAGSEVFARLPVDTQRFILGPAKFRAFQDGELDLEDVVGFRIDPKWGPVGWERSLRDILGDRADAWLEAAD